MTNHDVPSLDRARALMMAALDNEIAPDEQRELDDLIARLPQLADEWSRLSRVKEVTVGMTLQRVPEEIWDTYWTSVYRRVERGISWILISLGAIVLGAYGLWQAITSLITADDEPAFIRYAILAVATGFAILVVSVIREKFFLHRKDPYKEIVR